MKLIIKVLVILTVLAAYTSAYAGWEVTNSTDPITDDAKKIAIVKNQAGHSFSIYRLPPEDLVWGTFSLSDSTVDQIDSERPPIYWVDNKTPYNLSTSKDLDEKYDLSLYQREPKWVNFVVWHGKVDEGVSGDIVDIVKGHEIFFNYYTVSGDDKDTSFTLKGSAAAVSEIVGINMEKAIGR